ncbi:MAG: sigma-54 dependent transcriptional regulator, partial [bacterium]|nr:sigma-54 dependent transcriptional regulator [bacterium]
MEKGRVLIVDDELSMVHALEKGLKQVNYLVFSANNGTEATRILTQQIIDVALIDLNLPGYSGLQLLQYVKNGQLPTEVILISGKGTIEAAVSAVKNGAYDYLEKPFPEIEQVLKTVNQACEKRRLVSKIHELEGRDKTRKSFHGIVGHCGRIQEIFSLVENIASSESNVLILGESGTGKELVARAVHTTSPRKEKPFVVINCSAIPETLLESTLFGHKKGAFTGAVSDKRGLFEEANGGTVFLDEVGDISLSMQVKLLRVLQDGEFRPVGGEEIKHVNVRIISATNKNLLEAVRRGSFREDLFYRLNVIGFQLPPLRDRREDIPLLAYHFLSEQTQKTGSAISKISVDALQALTEASWKGNIRELENVIER